MSSCGGTAYSHPVQANVGSPQARSRVAVEGCSRVAAAGTINNVLVQRADLKLNTDLPYPRSIAPYAITSSESTNSVTIDECGVSTKLQRQTAPPRWRHLYGLSCGTCRRRCVLERLQESSAREYSNCRDHQRNGVTAISMPITHGR